MCRPGPFLANIFQRRLSLIHRKMTLSSREQYTGIQLSLPRSNPAMQQLSGLWQQTGLGQCPCLAQRRLRTDPSLLTNTAASKGCALEKLSVTSASLSLTAGTGEAATRSSPHPLKFSKAHQEIVYFLKCFMQAIILLLLP